jgi:hypothetical protein
VKSIKRYLLLVTCIMIGATSVVVAQDLSAELSRVGTLNVKNYVNPIFNGFAADLNSGFYHSADLHGVLGFDVGVKVGFSLITASDKKYDFITPDSIGIKNPANLAQTISLKAGRDYDAVVSGVPTAVGDKNTKFYVKMIRATGTTPEDIVKQGIYDNLITQHGSNNLFQIPNGFDLPAVPLPMPQAAIGLPFGLEVIIRFIPTVSAGNVGNFNYMGFGLRYNVDQWVPMLPLDVAVHFMTQKMYFKSKDDKDIFNASGTAYGVEVSKKLLFLTVYGGFQLEKATFTLSQIDGKFTTPDGTETPFTIPETTFEGQNKSRATLGLRLLLAVVNLHAEYSFAKTPVAAIGVGISLR